MLPMTDETILVNASPLPDQLWAGMRQLAPAVIAFAVGRQIIPQDAAPLLAAAGLFIWPIVAGQLKTRHFSKALARLAASPEVPDHLVQTK